MAKKWIAGAIKEEGSLRRAAGVKEGETISEAQLGKLEARAKRTGNTKLLKRVNLARTLRKMRRSRRR